MVLSPTNFAVPNSTTLKILFNLELSENINSDNINIVGLEGGIDNLKVKSVSVSGRLLIINTYPQSSGGFYKIILQDSEYAFESSTGIPISHAKSALYFVGFKKFNPIRDRITNKVTKAYSKNNSNVSRLLDVHAEEFYDAQRSIGQVLNDNYIRVSVKDEIRKRSSSAKDHLVHENCFKVKRVSLSPQGVNFGSKNIYLSSDDYRDIDDNEVVSLQEVYKKEIIPYEKFKRLGIGYTLSLSNKNIIKVISIKFVKPSDEEDCDGSIGTFYPLQNIRYGISDDFYDKSYAYKRFDIESDVVFINDFGYNHEKEDQIIVEYLYKDLSIQPDLNTLSVSYIDSKDFEPIPLNENIFNLEQRNISLEDGTTPIRSGITFFKDFSNKDDRFFIRELGLLNSTGDFSVDYESGKISVFGNEGFGIEEDIILASYKYNKMLEADKDFYVDDEFNLFVNYYSIYLGKKITVNFQYSIVFAEGTHYKNSTNLEAIGESVGENFSDFFTIETKNSPVSEVFRIFNKTTGEVYQPVSIFENRVRFSGSKSPEFLTSEKEVINYLEQNNERLEVSNRLPEIIGSTDITSLSESIIYFNPIDYSPGLGINFYVKSLDRNKEALVSSLIQSGGKIIGARFSSNPNFILNESISIFYNVSQIKLSNENIMGLENFLGNHINSSIRLDKNIFKKEKSIHDTSKFKNFGDYKVDYKSGFLYAAINVSDPNSCSYRYASFFALNPRIMSIDEIGYLDFEAEYSMDGQTVEVKNIPSSIESESIDNSYDFRDGIFKKSLTVLKDKTIVTSKSYESIRHMDLAENIYSSNLSKFSSSKHSYYKNIIDLKIKQKSKFNIFEDEILIETNLNSNKVYKITNSVDGSILYDGINLNKFSFVAKKVSVDEASVKIYLSSNEISNVETDDLVLHNGESYRVTSVNHISGYIEVSGSENITEGVIAKEVFEYDRGGKRVVSIPIDLAHLVSIDDYYEIQYFEDDGINPGDEVFVDYNLGNLTVSYTYVKDDVYISYQHGDNSLDWSVSEALIEGQDYYVDYEFGALRTELRKNFGVLTEIPFFNNFELNVDREFYRDSLEGTLQSFANGPIIESYDNLVQNITKTAPEIKESFYRGWVLNSDFLVSNSIRYSDDLIFETCKYKEGLLFERDGFVSLSSDNKLPISEGTVSGWTQNSWSGISNDANIIFEIQNCGNEKYSFSKDMKNRVDSSSKVLTDKNSFYLINNSDNLKSFVSSIKRIDHLNPGCDLGYSFNFKIHDAEEYAFDSGEFFSFSLNDSNRIIDFEIKPEYLGGQNPINFNILDIDYADAPKLSSKVPTINCKCSYPESNEIFGFLSTEVEIYFDSNINLSDEFQGRFDKEGRQFYLQDNSNGIYKVLYFIDEFGNKSNSKFDGEIKGVIVNRKPIFSSKSITRKFVSKDFLVPNTSFKIFCSVIKPKLNTESYKQKENYKDGILFDLSKETEVFIDFNPKINSIVININSNQKSAEFFYSDFFKKNEVSSYRPNLTSKFQKYLSDYPGISFSIFNILNKQSVRISKFKYSLNNYLSKKDIYIGKNSRNPDSNIFTIYGDDDNSFGVPSKYSDAEGVFIFKDELRNDDFFSPSKSNWAVRVKEISTLSVPSSVNSDGSFEYEYFSPDEAISGKIFSENNFYRATFSKSLNQNLSNEMSISMRYTKGSILSDGWSNVENSFPDTTNLFLDGIETSSYSWFSSDNLTENVINGNSIFDPSDSNHIISTKSISLSGITSHSMISKVSLDISKLRIAISGRDNSFYTGIRPIEISSDSFSISSEYIVLDGRQAFLITNEKTGETIGTHYFNWNNSSNNLKFEVDKQNGIFYFYLNESIVLSKPFSVDKKVESCIVSFCVRSKGFYSGEYNFEVTSLEYKSDDPKFEEDFDDHLEIGDDYIEFSFKNRIRETDEYYGYEEDYNELLFVSDREKTFFETKSENSSSRIYKDGSGYLNFVIEDFGRSYAIMHDIKNIEEKSISHIAGSWSINETDNRMSLYFNGKEVPNTYSLGSQIGLFADEKFGDISKEKIQDSYFSKIQYYESGTMNTSAGSNNSFSEYITESDVGMFIEVVSSDLYSDLVGSLLYISKYNNGQISFKNGITDEDFIFTTSAEVEIRFPPSIGINNSLETNISDQKFKIFVDDIELREHLSGSGNFDFVANKEKKFIQFLGINESCKYSSSINSYQECHLKNYGLRSYFINEDVSITESIEDINYLEKYNFIISKINTTLPEPLTTAGVDIYKVFEENLVPDFAISSSSITWGIEVSHDFVSKTDRYKSSSFFESSDGRVLELDFFSYNIDFSAGPVEIKIIGNEGLTEEVVTIIKSGKYKTSSKFNSIERMESSLNIIDVDEEPFSITISELVPITKDLVKVFKYSEGAFIIGGQNEEYSSYELTTGIYNFRYNTKLDISNERFGDSLFIGNSKDLKKSWLGSIEEFKISNKFYSESNAFKEYISTKPMCPDKNTMCLIPFNDPYEIQKEKLRKEVFLGSDNFKFRLEKDDVLNLMSSINSKFDFVSKLMSLGISRDVAEMTFTKCHKAHGGPIFDISNFNPEDKNKGNRPGPNENFSGSFLLNGYGVSVDTSKKVLDEKEFSINTWVSPSFDSETNNGNHYIFSASNSEESIIKAENNRLTLPQPASSLIRIEAVTKKGERFLDDSKLYGKYNITGKTGSNFNFKDNSKLSNTGVYVDIQEGVSDPNGYYKVLYSPKSNKSQNIDLYINKESEVVLNIKSYSKSVTLSKEYIFDHLSWYKFLIVYKSGEIKVFVNGEKIISYKDPLISFKAYFGNINFMSDNSGQNVFSGKISSTKISRKANGYKIVGSREKDINYLNKYSDNRELVLDEYTTYINNFNFELKLGSSYSEVIDKKSGIFDFDINISDPFEKLDKDYKKDLVEYLVNRIKPAHSNAIVKIKNDRC